MKLSWQICHLEKFKVVHMVHLNQNHIGLLVLKVQKILS
jgi:hypothetical protein